MSKEKFFIGWQGNISREQKGIFSKVFVGSLIVGLLIVTGFVLFQKSFNSHIFEFGKKDIVTGIYFKTPVPMLIADSLPEGLSNEILLVGYGKFGAEGIMDVIENEYGQLQGARVKLSGTMIHGDGRTVMELTEKKNSLIKVYGKDRKETEAFSSISAGSFAGEIIDPKCYFGVMKPGEGKVHKSCAIRCISGGIPPVFRVKSQDGYEYYILLDSIGKEINLKILDFIAEDVTIKGEVKEIYGWKYLFCNPSDISLN